MNYLDGVKAIVFDLGGVIVDLDINKTRNELAVLLGLEQPELYYSQTHVPLFSDYEVGKITADAFLDGLLKQSLNGTTREKLIEAWNAMLLNIPVKRIEMLERLKPGYRLFILSNTNSIHVERFEKMAPGYNTLSELFDSAFYSHLLGVRKPDQTIFEAVIAQASLDVTSTLFVDDLPANIEAAKQLGFKTLLIEAGMEIADLL